MSLQKLIEKLEWYLKSIGNIQVSSVDVARRFITVHSEGLDTIRVSNVLSQLKALKAPENSKVKKITIKDGGIVLS